MDFRTAERMSALLDKEKNEFPSWFRKDLAEFLWIGLYFAAEPARIPN